ncbi:3-hydroxyacyl-[acyl-carrier-protein] dehydratase FabZ [Streptomyces sp. enrichment culture]|uniref:3-hydroxyacyl-ACP dehydratase FabZ family protein n=1 Tax=Streptomyces sp. enrichment culture TaxID=1795815 RepID=UPI003F577AD8
MTAATPLGDLEVIRTGPEGAVTAFDAPTDGPVVAGHYPGFPVLPGVFLIEAADRTVRQWARSNPPAAEGARDGEDDGIELAGMDRCRFHRPVLPGDRVLADVSLTGNAADLMFRAAVATNRGKVADLRLRYRVKGAGDGHDGEASAT